MKSTEKARKRIRVIKSIIPFTEQSTFCLSLCSKTNNDNIEKKSVRKPICKTAGFCVWVNSGMCVCVCAWILTRFITTCIHTHIQKLIKKVREQVRVYTAHVVWTWQGERVVIITIHNIMKMKNASEASQPSTQQPTHTCYQEKEKEEK